MDRMPNSWTVTREFGKVKVVVQCFFMVQAGAWALTTKINGHIVTHHQVDQPWQAAQCEIEKAFENELADQETTNANV